MSVSIESVSKYFGATCVLDAVSLEVPDGTVVGIAGINGSGKTMLMRVAAGLVRPAEGVVRADGAVLGRDADFPPSVGVLIESPAFLDFRTGLENLSLIASIKGLVGRDACERELARVGLDPHDKRRFRAYSLGMRQRLGLAAALLERPRFIILDEPSNALDEQGVSLLKRLVAEEKRRGAAILLSCHDKVLLDETADEIHVMENGRIVESSPARGEALFSETEQSEAEEIGAGHIC